MWTPCREIPYIPIFNDINITHMRSLRDERNVSPSRTLLPYEVLIKSLG